MCWCRQQCNAGYDYTQTYEIEMEATNLAASQLPYYKHFAIVLPDGCTPDAWAGLGYVRE